MRSISEPTQTNAGPSPSQSELARGPRRAGRGSKASRSTPQSTTSIFAAAAGSARSGGPQASASWRSPRGAVRRRPAVADAAPDSAEVGDVLAVRHHDQRRPRGQRRERPGGAGGEEEVREDDVGAPRGRAAATASAAEPRVLGRRAAPAADRDDLDLVADRLELTLDRDQEAARGPGSPGWATSELRAGFAWCYCGAFVFAGPPRWNQGQRNDMHGTIWVPPLAKTWRR